MENETKVERAKWSSKWTFILAAAASAVGLGNLWRFPYLAAEYGGGTFLFTYICLVFTLGISLLILEMALGRKTGLSAIGAFKSFGKKYAFIGVIASLIPFIITPYYCIIGGWVVKYFFAYFMEGPAVLGDGGSVLVSFMSGNLESYLWLFVFMGLTFLVVARGVKGGIEKANLILMPALILMIVGLCGYVAMQPGAIEGIAYYLVPDFSKFSVNLVVAALGQMFFSMSLAMGIMITYGSYVEKKESLTSSAIRVGGFDLGFSILAGLLIVPCAFLAFGSGDAVAAGSGPGLMFIVLPQMFMDFGDAAVVIGACFFALVFFAAITSSISLVETCVSIIQDATNWTRTKSMIVTFSVIFVSAIFINLGYNGLSFIHPMGGESTLLDFADFLSNTIMMPIAALLTCIFVGWIIKPETLIEEVAQSTPFKFQKAWAIIIKYIAPVAVVIILVAFTMSTFGLLHL